MKIKIKRTKLVGYIRQLLYITLPTRQYVKVCYRWFSKGSIDLDHPKRLSEKWWWVMYYNEKHCPDLIRRIADKYEVTEYMQEKGYGKYLKKMFGVYDSPDEIDFDSLPDKFALKLTKASGYNIICTDKSKLDVEEVKRALREMLFILNKQKWTAHNLAWINEGKARIICEEFLEKKDGSQFLELNFYCCNGVPKFTLVVNDYLDDDGKIGHDYTRNLYDADWNPLPVEANYQKMGYVIPKPEEYEEAYCLALELAKDFLFLRVDLYVGDGRVILSELTPAPAGLTHFEPEEWDYRFGDMLELPNVKVF